MNSSIFSFATKTIDLFLNYRHNRRASNYNYTEK